VSRRYLSLDEVEQTLRRGRSVEQWLGAADSPQCRTVHWLRIEKEPDGRFTVWRVASFDPQQPNLLDVYEFLPFDVDEPDGIPETVASLDEAIDYACKTLGANAERFVNAGVIQDEYRDFGRPSP
jgi:hypothetical protein